MPNDVFRATDAVLVLGVDDTESPEGKAADALVSQYDLSNVVGRLTSVSISITSDVRPFFEIGRRYPTHLRPGAIHVSGSAERAHVNGALLKLSGGALKLFPPARPPSGRGRASPRQSPARESRARLRQAARRNTR